MKGLEGFKVIFAHPFFSGHLSFSASFSKFAFNIKAKNSSENFSSVNKVHAMEHISFANVNKSLSINRLPRRLI